MLVDLIFHRDRNVRSFATNQTSRHPAGSGHDFLVSVARREKDALTPREGTKKRPVGEQWITQRRGIGSSRPLRGLTGVIYGATKALLFDGGREEKERPRTFPAETRSFHSPVVSKGVIYQTLSGVKVNFLSVSVALLVWDRGCPSPEFKCQNFERARSDEPRKQNPEVFARLCIICEKRDREVFVSLLLINEIEFAWFNCPSVSERNINE